MRATVSLSAVAAVVAIVAAGCGGGGSLATATHAATRRPTPPQGALYSWGREGDRAPGFPGEGTKGPSLANGRRSGSRTAPGGVDVPTVIRGVVGTVVQVATSNTDGYALTAAGTVYAWGGNSQGQLGDGSIGESSATAVPVRFPPGVTIASLPDPMPFNGGMAIDTAGTAWGWGNNTGRQFCLPRSRGIAAPKRIPLPHVTLAAGAWTHALYDSAGRILSCGRGRLGQLGDGKTGKTTKPAAVLGLPGGPVKALTSSWGDAGVLMSDGAYYDWGYNHSGQVGDGTTTTRLRAVRVSLPGSATEVSQGGSLALNGQTLALLADGSVEEWGNGSFGQLGDHSTRSSLVPFRLTEPAGVRFVAVHSGGATDYALDSAHRLFGWGHDNWGQVGNGVREPRQTVPENDEVTMAAVSATASFAAGYVPPTRGS